MIQDTNIYIHVPQPTRNPTAKLILDTEYTHSQDTKQHSRTRVPPDAVKLLSTTTQPIRTLGRSVRTSSALYYQKVYISPRRILYLRKLRVGSARKNLQPGTIVSQVTPPQISHSPGSEWQVVPVVLMHWRNNDPWNIRRNRGVGRRIRYDTFLQ